MKLSTIARFPEGAGKQDDFKNHEGVGKRGMSSGSVERQELRPSSRVGPWCVRIRGLCSHIHKTRRIVICNSVIDDSKCNNIRLGRDLIPYKPHQRKSESSSELDTSC